METEKIPDNPVVGQMLQDLKSRNLDVRCCAVRSIRALTPDEQYSVFVSLLRYCDKRTRRLWPITIMIAVLCILGLVLANQPSRTALNLLLWGPSALGGLIYWLMNLPVQSAWMSLEALAKVMEDIRLVPIALTLREKREDNRFRDMRQKVSRQLLIKLLHRLKPGDEEMLSLSHKSALMNCLDMTMYDIDLTLAALKGLEIVGDQNALRRVQRLADLSPMRELLFAPIGSREASRSFGENVKRLQQAAQQCRASIEGRLKPEQQAQTLLRASDAPSETAPETLLRPAGAASSLEAHEELLRPTSDTKAASEN